MLGPSFGRDLLVARSVHAALRFLAFHKGPFQRNVRRGLRPRRAHPRGSFRWSQGAARRSGRLPAPPVKRRSRHRAGHEAAKAAAFAGMIKIEGQNPCAIRSSLSGKQTADTSPPCRRCSAVYPKAIPAMRSCGTSAKRLISTSKTVSPLVTRSRLKREENTSNSRPAPTGETPHRPLRPGAGEGQACFLGAGWTGGSRAARRQPALHQLLAGEV